MNSEMMISGKWFNKNTNDVVTVVNNVIDGDQMIIITDKGPITMNEFADYIQMSEEIYDEHGKVIGKEQINYNNIPKPTVSIKETKKTIQQNKAPVKVEKNNNLDFNDSTFVSIPEPVVTKPTIKNVIETVSNNEHIISKFFDKIKDKEKLIQVNLDTSILPINDLRTITNYMDVSTDEIATYISEKLVNKTYISNIIQQALTKLLDKAEN